MLQKNLAEQYNGSKRTDSVIHVSDILPPPYCIRRAYYGRRFPELNIIDEISANHFLRGQASEYALTRLAKAGISQLDVKFGSVKGHPDIASEEIIFELKDTTSSERMDIKDDQFKSYLRQLIYYMVMTDREKGIICITYNTGEYIYQRRTMEGELYLKPYGSKREIQSWDVYLSSSDPIRDEIKEEIKERENLFKTALKDNDVTILPRLPEKFYKSKCNWCPYQKKCYKEDEETAKAYKYGNKKDLLENKIDFSFDQAPNII